MATKPPTSKFYDHFSRHHKVRWRLALEAAAMLQVPPLEARIALDPPVPTENDWNKYTPYIVYIIHIGIYIYIHNMFL